ncbi:nitrogen permease regulator 2, partial [Tremellales sp. Uapishka_1]
MGVSDESFLPQLVGLFYATFDPKLGPTVLHQVPENLITSTSPSDDSSRSNSRSRSRSRAPRARSVSSSRFSATVLDFAPISEYVIPKKSLHGKLVTLLTAGWDEDEKTEYRIMGFPSVIEGEGGRYMRNEYMWNLCFVFQANSVLEAFEPVVRKCGRILRSAEIDSAYLSAPNDSHTPLPAVLEQLFEDLNSYSETSIPLDGFNSLELKLFPFYPNPPECQDWHVPIALVDLNALKDDNWDITAARVSLYIDGVNHVRRISELADADPALTRETLRHMLYYQVIMMVRLCISARADGQIDIFQYSNMYTVKPSIIKLAQDETVIQECGAYVTRPGFAVQSWPILAKLYSHLLPGTTVHQWVEANGILAMGIDPRRFVSFGIIKGFLRRVHRWPLMIERANLAESVKEGKRKVGFSKVDSSFNLSNKNDSGISRHHDSGVSRHHSDKALDSGYNNRPAESAFTLRSTGSNASLGLGISPSSVTFMNRTPPSLLSRSPRALMPFAPVNPTSISSALESQNSGTGSRKTLRSGGRSKEEDRMKELEEMLGYLDGYHHSDEIQVRYGINWTTLEKILGAEECRGPGRKGVTLVLR